MATLPMTDISEHVDSIKTETRSFTPQGETRAIEYSVVVLTLSTEDEITLSVKGENKYKLQRLIDQIGK